MKSAEWDRTKILVRLPHEVGGRGHIKGSEEDNPKKGSDSMYRLESDFIGELQIPTEAYYGIQTARAAENFQITGIPVERELIIALAEVKKAAARANMTAKRLNEAIGKEIVSAAEEIIQGNHLQHFIVDAVQGGAGTSFNMNMNEVLANLALEKMSKAKGDYFYCSPNNHVNMSQSTNDTIPTAIKIAAYRLAGELLESLRILVGGFLDKAAQFNDVIKMGRTHLQDAVPIRLGQEFRAYAKVLERDVERIVTAVKRLLVINMGATAVGTGLNADPIYTDKVVLFLSEQLGVTLSQADDLVDATQNTDAFMELSATLKVCAVNVSKICNDIRLMASGPRAGMAELKLPPRQPGSSIMPGKVNPVMAEVLNQIAFQVIGNDHTISLACEAGQFELNVMEPVIAFNLLQSIKMLKNGFEVFYKFALIGMEAERETCRRYVEESYGIMTALNPHLGYEVAARIVKEAQETGRTVKDICLERQLLTLEEMDEILDPFQMTTPGIAGERFLKNH